MNIPHQPICNCLECRYYGLVYSSLADVYKCKECKTNIRARFVEEIVLAYSVYSSANSPLLIPNYNAITCYSCLEKGGLGFKGIAIDTLFCTKCKYSIPFSYLHDAMTNSYKTKLIERTYNHIYKVFGEGK